MAGFIEMNDVFCGWNAGLSLQRRWLFSWICCMEKAQFAIKILDKHFNVKSQMRQSACFIGNIPKMQFYWGTF